MNKKVETKNLWAPIVSSSRTEWIYFPAISSTRRDARKAWLQGVSPERHAEALKNVRFARVDVSEAPK